MDEDGAVPGHGPWPNISIMPTVSTCNSGMPVTAARLLAYEYDEYMSQTLSKSPCVLVAAQAAGRMPVLYLLCGCCRHAGGFRR